jgi:dolichol-phosphate mannosyltransferase/undecaprenyl-phosphate 4-deoxy-4-formamido-L-arabinose transferase
MAPTGSAPLYSIVVPVYNTAATLPALARRVAAVFTQTVQRPWELIFVDDGSPNPETWPLLERLAREEPGVRAIRLTRNFGQTAAILCGLEAARGEHIVLMDDDLQHPPEEIPALIAARAHDVVVARYRRRRHGPLAKLTSAAKNACDALLLQKPRRLRHSSFLLMHRAIARGILTVRTSYPLLSPLIYHVTRDVVNVEVDHHPRRDGRTGYTLGKRVRLFSNLIINNSSLLLALIGWLGVSVAALAFGLFLFYLGRKLFFGIGMTGWTSLMVVLLGVGGLLLFSVGVIGTYLLRIIHTSENRPSYVVRCRAGEAEEGGGFDGAGEAERRRELGG